MVEAWMAVVQTYGPWLERMGRKFARITLMFQQVLEEPGWLEQMMVEDLRALSPLIYHHINPYGTFELDMAERLPIKQASGSLAA
jgi:Tn3 transposase DDE domain-containing protein